VRDELSISPIIARRLRWEIGLLAGGLLDEPYRRRQGVEASHRSAP
jgi:hypothetical protein